jgi:preprotein translocase subunit SecF
VEQSDLRSALTDLGHPDARIQQTADGEFLVRTRELAGTTTAPPVGPVPPSEREALEAALRERLGNFEVVEFATVSPVVSEEIGRNAAIAVGVASVAIMVYITWAFRSVPKPLRYGTAALIALAHDVLIVLGVFSILGKAFGLEVNTMFITGVLTVIGFSVHDTIVVFDRIRENVARMEGSPFEQVVNVSLLQTMGRSLNTSLTVILTLVALLLLGGATIQSFLLVLLIGFVAGTFSSIFNASQVLVAWEKGDVQRFLRRFLPIPEPASTTSS